MPLTDNLSRLGTTSVGMEYGVEKRISQFSHLRAAVSIMCPDGVSLKIRSLVASYCYTSYYWLSVVS